jgi:metal-sulfur cluster biosynthetic enzyme
MMVDAARVLDALSDVRDPELDEPITQLGFVSDLEIKGETVKIRLRLPTYFCAPNFAYLMVADTREAILSVRGVRWANVILDDHYASDEINGGVNEGQGFDGAFPGETEGPNLGELRSIFQRKSFVSRQEKLCRALLAGGRTPAELVRMQVGDLPPTDEAEKYLKRRAELGLDVSPGDPLIVDPDGRKVPEVAVVEHLRFARTVRVSIEGNAGLCRGLLTTRYGLGEKEEVKR